MKEVLCQQPAIDGRFPEKEVLNKEFLSVFAGVPGRRIEAAEENGTVYPAFDLTEEPLIGYARVDDPVFESFREKEIIGPSYMLPGQWLEGAKTVISFAIPFSEAVRASNREEAQPSRKWLYGRVEGQEFISRFAAAAAEQLERKGFRTCIPSRDERFSFENRYYMENDRETFHTESVWSERHAAYACGLGTFGLSRGLITEKGMAVRFASIVTDLEIDPDPRPYQRYDEYCIRCGACIRKCPPGAISETGKDNRICMEWVEKTRILYAPRYGCGKCQVGVPCEHGIPRRR